MSSSPNKPRLLVDWCSYAAAKYAVEHWHYSRSMPAGKMVRVGAWEDGRYIGCVLFSRGAAPHIGDQFGLKQTEVCELTRVALSGHETPTSRIISIALRMLRGLNDGLRLVVSFADTAQGHHGGIYQAGGWLYVGSQRYHVLKVHGQVLHPKTCYSRYGSRGQGIPWLRQHVDPNAERIYTPAKHKYLYPLDKEMRRQIEPLRLPYPKRVHADEATQDATGDQPGEGGANPTRPL